MNKNYIFVTSFFMTVIVFAIGFLLNYGLDFARIDEVTNIMAEHEMSRDSFIVQTNYIGSCNSMTEKLGDLKGEISKVGTDLSNYGKISFFRKKDFDYLKRKYFLLELRFYTIIQELNARCGQRYLPVLFFYEIDDDLSERQGYMLQDLNDEFKNEVIVLSFDKDYEDEPALNLLKEQFDITKSPTIIFNDIKHEGIMYGVELNNTAKDILYDRGIDKYAGDFSYTLKANGVNVSSYIENLELLFENETDYFTKGDLRLVIGRLTNNSDVICDSLRYYDNVSGSGILKALSYETIASVGCQRNKKAFYFEASKLWKELGNEFRASVNEKLAYRMELDFDFVEYNISGEMEYDSNASSLVIGDDLFVLDNETLVSQADRVTRDWLGLQYQNPYSDNVLKVFSERLTYDEKDLLEEVGWHEGGRILDLGVETNPVVGTLVKKFGNKWYASNLKGEFMFEVPLDKVFYPTTRFLQEDLAVIIDTHGINMLVERSELLNATLVIGCCDNIGKIRAAKYLSEQGRNVVCFTDKYLPLVMNQNLNILGSPVISHQGGKVILGDRPLTIDIDDKILVLNVSSKKYAISYYQTPTIFFMIFNQLYSKFDTEFFSITDFNEMDKFVDYANLINATVLATRVYDSSDYDAVSGWLEQSVDNKAILFHSMSYPYGKKLLDEYPSQTTFDDVNFG